jgi:glutaredoxin/glutathione-dependent peroxiredoxin
MSGKKAMAIKVGDRIPSVKIKHMTKDGVKDITTDELFNGKKVALFGLPGAFTRTCSGQHLPGYVQSAEALKGKGINIIACLSVNDAFVMDAWGKSQSVGDKVMMLADGNAELTKALGLEIDRSDVGFGMRSQRYSMLVDNGVVKQLNLEKPGAFEVSGAEALLKQL